MTRTYAVTGVGSGIGKALAEQLRAEGHRVIGADLRDADVIVDLTTAQGRADLVEKVRELSGGKLDAIVAVAGVGIPSAVTVAVNYFGAIATLQGLRPLLAGSDGPRAALVASIAVIDPFDQELLDALLSGDEAASLQRAEIVADLPSVASPLNYATSKRGIALWTRENAVKPEWAGAGIPLNAVAPGVIATAMTAPMLDNEDGRKVITSASPAVLNGPFAPPTAPAALLAWLTSVENTFVTGQIIYIDGGADALKRPMAV